jgi:hypothetical protein
VAPRDIADDRRLALARAVRAASKPIVVALNKADLAAPAQLAGLQAAIAAPSVPVSAQSELALAKGAQTGALEYAPGEARFEPVAQLSPQQRAGLDYIRDHVMEPFGGTGLHKALEAAAFDLLGLIPVFPVEDDHHFTDKDGNVLPDCHLVPRGTTAKQLAYRVHTDLGDHFVRAIDCRKKRAVAADHPLEAGDVIRIAASA